MSQETVEIVRRSIDAFRRADWEVMAATLDPHILVRTDANWPEPRFYGRKATIDFYEGLWESGGHDLFFLEHEQAREAVGLSH